MIDLELLQAEQVATPIAGAGILWLGTDGVVRVRLHDGSDVVAQGVAGPAGPEGPQGPAGGGGSGGGSAWWVDPFTVAAAPVPVVGMSGYCLDGNYGVPCLAIATASGWKVAHTMYAITAYVDA